MLRCLPFILLIAVTPPAPVDKTMTVKIGGTDIKLSYPSDMVDMPKDNFMTKAAADLTPPDCLLLRSCVSSDAVDTSKPYDPLENYMSSHTFAMKDVPMDVDAGVFIDFVANIANKATHGVLESKEYRGFDYDETQTRLDKFQKDTGVGIQQDGALYSLGMVSRSTACVSYMAAQYLNVTFDGKTQRVKCVSVIAYLRLKKKVLITATSLTKDTILQDDVRMLKHAAEKYQCDLQLLNN